MSGPLNNNLTIAKAINNTEVLYGHLLRSAVASNSRTRQPGKDFRASAIVRAELIHLGNVRSRAIINSRNIDIQKHLIQDSREVMEKQYQDSLGQAFLKMSDKIASLFRKSNLSSQELQPAQNIETISNPALVNQDAYPLIGNIAASADTSTALSLEAGEVPTQAAINNIDLNSLRLAEQVPAAFNQSVNTLDKISKEFTKQPINASLL